MFLAQEGKCSISVAESGCSQPTLVTGDWSYNDAPESPIFLRTEERLVAEDNQKTVVQSFFILTTVHPSVWA
jgi:hypothetical protein